MNDHGFDLLVQAVVASAEATLKQWAQTASLDTTHLSVSATPKIEHGRITEITLTIRWTDLPTERLAAARRAAELSPVYQTLTHPPIIVLDVK